MADEREIGLPGYLQRDLDAFKEGVRTKSTLLDCLWGELYGSINGAEIDDQVITHDFSACPRVPGRAYNGANGKKIAVTFEGAVWLLKFPPNAVELQRQFYRVYLDARRAVMKKIG